MRRAPACLGADWSLLRVESVQLDTDALPGTAFPVLVRILGGGAPLSETLCSSTMIKRPFGAAPAFRSARLILCSCCATDLSTMCCGFLAVAAEQAPHRDRATGLSRAPAEGARFAGGSLWNPRLLWRALTLQRSPRQTLGSRGSRWMAPAALPGAPRLCPLRLHEGRSLWRDPRR